MTVNDDFRKYAEKAEREMAKALRGEKSQFTPFGDDDARRLIGKHNHAVKVRDTQHGIIKYAEPIAQFIAEAARASSKALGHSHEQALAQWLTVIERRAKEILHGEGVQEQEQRIFSGIFEPFIENEP
jgi:alkylated DNA nucleotide flippase Atl1